MTTTPNLGMQELVSGQLQPEVTVNNALLTLDATIGTAGSAFGYDLNTSSGMTFGYFGGVVLENGAPVAIAAGTVALTASATNYVQRTPGGIVSVNTTGYTPGYIPMATVVAGSAAITTVTDTRPAYYARGGRLVMGIGAPTGVAVVTATTGGTLAAATYGYRVSAVYPWGESVASAEVQVTTTGTTSENTISWTLPSGATAAKVYGRTVGGELYIATVNAGTSSYTDTGSVTSSGALPTGTLTLTEAQTNAAILSLQGALTGSTTVDFPTRPQQWVVSNETTGSYVTTCQTASGTGVSVAQGSAEVLYCNGTNIIAASSSGGGGGSSGATTVQIGTGITLTPTQAADAIIRVQGALTANAELQFPSGLIQVWEVSNETTGAYTLTAIVSGSAATAITLPQGVTTTVWSDGTNLHVVTAAGAAGGDLTGNYPSPSLTATGVTAGSYTMADITVDAKGRVTVAANAPAAGGDLTGTYPDPALITTGVTAATYTAPQITVDAKGRITSATNTAGATATLPASPLVSGTVYQNTGNLSLTIVQPVTYSPTSTAAATLAVALGNTSTPPTIDTESIPATAVAGTVRAFVLTVPPGWYYIFTATNATLGTALGFTGSNVVTGVAPSDFAENPATTTGLTWGYMGGTVSNNGTPVIVTAGTITLTASATNYVECSPSGTVSANTTGWTAGAIPLRELVTSASAITSDTDSRSWLSINGVISFNGRTGAVTLTAGDVTSVLNGATLAGPLNFGGNLIEDYAEQAASTAVDAFALPGSPAVTTSATGGTLAASTTYTYELEAVYANGHSGPTVAVSVTTGTGTTNSNTITWTVPSGATSVNVYGNIAGSVGLLANVASGGTSYTDTGGTTPGAAIPTIQSQTLNFSAGAVQEITLNASSALTFSNVPATGSASMTLIITQGATGGPFTITWPTGTKWPGRSGPVLSTAASAVDVIVLTTINGGTNWYGFFAGKGMA